jgi:IS30 family transposase
MRDKITLHTCLYKLKNRKSSAVSKVIIKRLSQVNYPMHTITFDNDKGFADHNLIANKLNLDTYYT